MKIIPAIDLLNGNCVRLYQGNYQQKTIYPSNPVSLAQQYQASGAQRLHIVDLNGAKEKKLAQFETIVSIIQSVDLSTQLGGGIRNVEDIECCLLAGIDQIVLGSMAVNNPKICAEYIQKYGAENFVLALDVTMKDFTPIIVSEAWEQSSGQLLWDLVGYYQSFGIRDILCTDISRDGTLQGPNLQLYQEAIERYPNIQWQASGGIGCTEDLKGLAQLNIHAVIIGRALYEGKVNLVDAIGELQC